MSSSGEVGERVAVDSWLMLVANPRPNNSACYKFTLFTPTNNNTSTLSDRSTCYLRFALTIDPTFPDLLTRSDLRFPIFATGPDTSNRQEVQQPHDHRPTLTTLIYDRFRRCSTILFVDSVRQPSYVC